jgi:toxin YoeB
MTIAFTRTGWEDYEYWQQNDQDNVEKINKLIKEIQRDPFRGTGKPEALRGNLAGYWSRRITGEHRLVYKVEGTKPKQILTIIQARFHY